MIISYLEFREQDKNIIIDFPTKRTITKIDGHFYVTKDNDEFIQNFFSYNIDFIYSIVGKNASGKTSLLKSIIKILEGEFEEDYIVIFEENINGVTNYLYLSKERKVKIDGEEIEEIDSSILFKKVSTVLLTNMVDDNEMYNMYGNIINLSKTTLIDQSESLQMFFSNEMTRNINFVANYKNDIKIENYINLPKELNYSLEKDLRFSIRQKEGLVNYLAEKAKSKYNNPFMDQIIANTAKNVDTEYENMKKENNHINYIEVEALFNNNKYDFDKLIKYIEKVLPDIISLKRKEGIIKRFNKPNKFKDKKEEEAFSSFLEDSNDYPEENIFFDKYYKNKEYKINLSILDSFFKILKDWQFLLDEYYEIVENSIFYEEYDRDVEGVIDIESIYNLTKNKEKTTTNWEDDIIYTWRNLSSGENAFLSIFSRLYEVKADFKENIILIIDEGDMSFHPEWQQQWVNILTRILEEVFKLNKFQIIVSTHSPFILSDLPNSNILLLGKEYNMDTHDLKLSFGSNIQDLLTHKFFISSGLTGEFAKNKINNVVDSLLENDNDPDKLLENKKIINMIGEPLVRKKVHDLYMEKMNNISNLEFRLSELQKQINHLQERLEKNE
ncbi:AAA family ATPase [Enterococcus durans]|uniref:AAA family ATPase n=1 Tax=Enterococcus durans TaxID=53345 RepID=UPI003D6B297F